MASNRADDLPPSYFEAIKMPGAVGDTGTSTAPTAPPCATLSAGFAPSFESGGSSAFQWNAPLPDLDRGVFFVDFVPLNVAKFNLSANETIQNQVDKANNWLLLQKDLEIKTCELVEFKVRSGGVVDVERSSFKESHDERTYIAYGVRLWFSPTGHNEGKPAPQIGYMSVVPTTRFTGSEDEPLDSALRKVNQRYRHSPFPGKIINMHTMKSKLHLSYGDTLDIERTVSKERGERKTVYVNILRIFYQKLTNPLPYAVELGLKDFIPNIGSSETHTQALARQVNQWLPSASSQRYQITNIQTVPIKLKDGFADTMRAAFTEHGESKTQYCKVLRVYYYRQLDSMASLNVNCITSKAFYPIVQDDYESSRSMNQRVYQWTKAADMDVMCVETVSTRVGHSAERYQGYEAMVTWNCGDKAERWEKIIWVYINGEYREPPIPAPPPHRNESDDCCIL